jgi:hypothetical protein
MAWKLFRRRWSRSPALRKPYRPVLENLEQRLLPSISEITVPAPQQTAVPEWWVNTDITGDSDHTVGPLVRCRRTDDPNTVTFDVVAFNVSGLGGFQFTLYFDPQYVSFVSADPNFLLTNGGGSIAFFSAVPSGNSVGVAAFLNWAQMPPAPGSGSGTLVRFVFSVNAQYGQTGFDIPAGSAGLIAWLGGLIPSDASHARAEDIIDPTHTVGCWTVNSSGDDPDLTPGEGDPTTDLTPGKRTLSLRAAIQEANAFNMANGLSGPHEIDFRIPGAGPTWTITPASALPALADPNGGIFLDALTQPGIVLNGAAAGGVADGVSVTTQNNAVKGLVINGFGGAGVHITGGGASNNQVTGNQIGTNAAGAAPVPNANGVVINGGASNNTVGGVMPADANVISGNTGNGVTISGNGTTNNLVIGNIIGLDATGTVAIPNGLNGVFLDGTAGSVAMNTIGGALLADRNFISGNTGNGVEIKGPGATGNLVQGNAIGIVVGNGMDGVFLNGASSNTLGGAAPAPGAAPGNLIGFNGAHGVDIAYAMAIASNAANNAVRGNLIASNGGDGVLINGLGGPAASVAGNTIGGAAADANIISLNALNGVAILGPGATGNLVQSDFIGTNPAGAPIGNTLNGVAIGSASNTIGGIGLGNVISANNQDGILITGSSATDNRVLGNNIGTSPDGASALPNGTPVPVAIGNGVTITGGAQFNNIGGSLAGEGNLISGNIVDNVWIDGGLANGNRVENNIIGPNAARTASLAPPSALAGVRISGGGTTNVITLNKIEGNNTEAVAIEGSDSNQVLANFIGSALLPNGTDGILVGPFLVGPVMAGSNNNLISGNSIGNNTGNGLRIAGFGSHASDGNLVTANFLLGNQGDGVRIETNANGNVVGGFIPEARNIIDGNFGAGVTLLGGANNTIAGNYIGVDPSGNVASPNGTAASPQPGVLVTTANNTIGPNNVISGNSGAGIEIQGAAATNNLVQGNRIGLNAAGTSALGNSGPGVFLNGAPGNTIGGMSPALGNVISANGADGIRIAGSSATANLVLGNLIGVDAAGSVARGNTGSGVSVSAAASTTIGGTVSGAGNVISGNTQNGVNLVAVTGTLVQGNRIGTNAAGTGPLGNSQDGIHLMNAVNNLIGGTTAGAGNVISGNLRDGVRLGDVNTTGILVQGNFIGTNTSGSLALGNGGSGVFILQASGNIIGGMAAGAGNTIGNNGVDGVLVDTGTANAIQHNSIYGHTNGLGIALVNNGNNSQPFPSLTYAASAAGSTTITGMLLGLTPNTSFTLEFFANAVANPSGFGEGQSYLGSLVVTTDGSGNATFTAMFMVGVPLGQFVSATATDPNNDTSQFAQNLVVGAPAP